MASGGSAWGSRSGFILASVGFAVGLGNIWRFPYVTGENGGSAFVLIYLLCAFGIGVPILMAEFLLGRRAQRSPPFAIAAVAQESGLSVRWSWVGNLTILTAFGILMSYAVVAGWVLYYFYLALTGEMLASSATQAQLTFGELLADPLMLVFWGAVALLSAALIIAAGVQQGIERAVKILMPMLFGLLLLLMVFNVFTGGMPQALDYLFTPDFSKVDGSTFLAALAQAFFSIGVAMAGMMMFGAYLPKTISIAQSAVIIVAAMFWFLNHTRTGKSMRAYSDNENLALLPGINPDRVVMITWILVAALATIAGTLYGLDKSFKPFVYMQLLLPIFASAIVGGVGNPVGAIAGGYVIAFSELILTFAYKKIVLYLGPETLELDSLVQILGTDYKIAVSFIILVIVLIIKPTGLFSGKTI